MICLSKIALLSFVLVFLSIDMIYAQKKDEIIITGEFTWNDWQAKSGWDLSQTVTYTPSDSIIKLLKNNLSEGEFAFILFGGSWCGDSKSEMPKIMAVIKSLGFENKVKILGVDRDKYEPSFTAKRLNIKKVPTLILTYNGEEMSRIVEFPREGSSWETDLLSIFQ